MGWGVCVGEHPRQGGIEKSIHLEHVRVFQARRSAGGQLVGKDGTSASALRNSTESFDPNP